MRSIWTGAITFGLVNVPVKVYSATEDHDVALHQVHDADGGRIRYQRRCEICAKVVPFDHINKAFDDGEQTVVLTADDFASLPAEHSKEIDVVEFVPSDQIDPIMLDRSYFLEPDGKSSKAYVLLRRTLEATDRTAIVHFALRQKTRLGALRVHGEVLMLQSLLWDDEVREAKFASLDDRVNISAKELDMSAALVESFAADFAPDAFNDDYQDELRALIEAKLKSGDAVSTEATFGEIPEEGEGGEVLDLMEALRRSVEASRDRAKPKSKPKQSRSAS
ncbi:Ku protein [Cryobacterium sp. Y82]|uniref:non-homologous end joining protein Ku n=1 Tax=Cryobacterium sp. Y82 TaxID=2045017 RepID=UPI000CE33B80|nr:Ku protein [Cryobacterium sp. Y82]